MLKTRLYTHDNALNTNAKTADIILPMTVAVSQ